jgi:hypothetical protein
LGTPVARGVHEEHRLVGRDRDHLAQRLGGGERGLVGVGGAAHREPARRPRHAGGGARRELLERGLVQQHAGLGVLDELAQLGRGEARVERERDRAEARRREDRLEEGAAVAEQDRHALAGPDPGRAQPARAARRALLERAVVERAPGLDQRGALARERRAAREPAAHVVEDARHGRLP